MQSAKQLVPFWPQVSGPAAWKLKKKERERELEFTQFTQVLCLIPPSRFIPTSMILVHSCITLKSRTWKMKFPFGFRLIFRGELLVLGSILRLLFLQSWFNENTAMFERILLLEGPIKLWSTQKVCLFQIVEQREVKTISLIQKNKVKCTLSRKTYMIMEKQQFEDVSPVKTGDFPVGHVSLQGCSL